MIVKPRPLDGWRWRFAFLPKYIESDCNGHKASESYIWLCPYYVSYICPRRTARGIKFQGYNYWVPAYKSKTRKPVDK